MNHADAPPRGPPGRDLTLLSDDDLHAQIQIQMGRWRTLPLYAEWYHLLFWFVMEIDSTFRRLIGWRHEYITEEGNLDYRTWFENIGDAWVYHVFDLAVLERKKAQADPSAGPSAAERTVTPPPTMPQNLYLINNALTTP